MERFHTRSLAFLVIHVVYYIMLPQEASCRENLALKKTTKQSSPRTKELSLSSFAVDGNTNGNYHTGHSCTHTTYDPNWHWWQVDLGDTYIVRSVRITNRNDCCPSRLKDFSIEVSEKEPSTLPGFPQTTNASLCLTINDQVPIPDPVTYECNHPVKGRYVRVLKEHNDPLTICEFEVFGNYTRTPNLARGKPASQSSDANGARAYRAVDGNLDGTLIGGSCANTRAIDAWHWWQVDFQDTYTLSAVRITNRNDCCSHRLQGFTIEVSEDEPSTLPGFPQTTNADICLTRKDKVPTSEPFMLECDQPVTGRYLRIVKKSVRDMPLTLCEVEVYEWQKPTEAPAEEWINGKNGLWRFIYIASQESSMDVPSSSALTRLLIDCARRRIGDRTDLSRNQYIHIDLKTTTCRFFHKVPEPSEQPSPYWVMYKLE